MAAPKTLAQIRQMALELADEEGYDRVETDEVNDRVNEGIRQLYDLLVVTRGENFYAVGASATSVAGQAVYDFSTDFGIEDFYRLTLVRASDGSRHVLVDSFEGTELPELLALEGGGGARDLSYVRYRLRSSGIEIRPAPSGASLTLSIEYIPACPELTTDVSTFDGINGWERWAALTAAIDLVNKEEGDPAPLMAQRGTIEESIRKLAGSRDANRPAKIRDVRGDWPRNRRFRRRRWY